MNSIYYDGTKYYKVGKHKDGSYVKFEVDDVGVYKQGGSIHKYGTIADMNMDVNKMYQMEYKDGGIHINPANKGKFNATKARTGKTTEELTHSPNPLTRKRAIFAQNAARWKHQSGGNVELDMVKETGPSWNHYNRFASPIAQINYANGLQNQIAVPGIGVIQSDTVIPDYQEFTTNVPRYAVTEKLPRNSKFNFKNIETAEKLINAYDKEAAKHVYDKDQTLRNDYLKKIKDVAEYIDEHFESRKQDGGKISDLLVAQSGATIKPTDDPSAIYAGDLIFSGGPAYSNNKLLNLATIDNPNQVKPLYTSLNDTLIQDTTPYNLTNNASSPVQNKIAGNTNIIKSNPSTIEQSQFNPRRLTTYGDKMAESALNRTTAYNLARALEPAYKNPLIMPEFKFKQQFAQADFNPVYEMQNVGMRNMANNARSTAALMGNLQQLNANMVKAKSDIARQAQTQQRGYDAAFQAQQQAYQNQLAQARQNVENLNKADEAEKFNYLSDTMTNWEKADQNRAKLYNANLQNWNEMNTYVNQLSPEYQAVRDKEGVVKIVFKSTGKEVPAEELSKKKAEYEARVNGTVANQTAQTVPTFTKPTFKMNYQFGKKKLGGQLEQVTTGATIQNKIKKLRTGLY